MSRAEPGNSGTGKDSASRGQAVQGRDMRLRDAERIARIGSWSYHIADDRLWWSLGMYRIFNSEPREKPLRLADLLALVHPADRGHLTDEISSGAETRSDYRVFLPGGGECWIHEEFEIERDAGGRPLAYHGTAQDVTKRKGLEEELRRSRELYRSVVDSQAELVDRYAPGGTLLFVNDALCRYTGMKREDLLGRSFYLFVHEEDRKDLVAAIEALSPEQPRVTLENRVVIDGEARWNRWEHHAFFDGEGNAVEYQSVGRDITEEKRTAEALKKSEEQYRELIMTIPAAVVVHSSDTAVVTSNATARKILGRSEDDMVNRKADASYWGLLNEDGSLVEEDDYPVNRAIREKRPVREMMVGINRPGGGETAWVLVNADPVFSGGRIERVVVSFMDVTARMKTDEALRVSEERLRALYKGTPTPMYTWRHDGVDFVLTDVSDAAHDFTAGKVADFIGMKAADMYAHRPDILDDLDRCLRGKSIIRREMDYRLASTGDVKRLSVSFSFVPPDTVLVHTVDDTERHRAREELKEARDSLEKMVVARTIELQEANRKLLELDTLKTMFIASMSHELRTPLNAILGFSGILLQGMAGELNEEQERQLSMVKGSADHLLALVNDVIDVSKIEAGKVAMAKQHFCLAEVVGEVLSGFDKEAGERDINLTCASCGSVTVRSDRRRVRQILMNLVGNALKFTPKGAVSLSIVERGSRVETAVTDTGVGIGTDDLEKLFRPFSRIENDGSPSRGTGLGLYLSRRIALLLDGDITVESAPGKGSTFTLILPAG